MSQFVHITGADTMETILSGRVAEPKNRFLLSRAGGLVFLATLKWFSRSWYAGFLSCRVSGRKTAHTFSGNTYGEQIGHSPKALSNKVGTGLLVRKRVHKKVAQLASICCVEGLNRVKNPLFALLRAYYCQLKRHIGPVYGSVT